MVREYDRLATRYDVRWARYLAATLDAVVEAVRPLAPATVLDVACGTGQLAQRLAQERLPFAYTGVDVSRAMLRHALGGGASTGGRWIQAEASSLPLRDDAYDVVVCANSFHYFPRPRLALREMRRVVHRGGRLVLVDWCDDYWACKCCGAWLRWTRRGFTRIWSLRQCATLLEQSGWRVEHAHRFRAGWIWGLMLLQAVADGALETKRGPATPPA